MNHTSRGFTIVELLIVIVVIGILAAITIVAFNGIQNRANDSSVQSDLANIAKKMESFKITSTDDRYPSTLDVTGLDLRVSKSAYGNHFTNANGDHNMVYCMDNPTTRTAYAIVARSKSGQVFAVSNSSSPKVISTAMVGAATTCPDQGMTSTNAWWGLYQSNWRIAG